jgi:hypothetical protein
VPAQSVGRRAAGSWISGACSSRTEAGHWPSNQESPLFGIVTVMLMQGLASGKSLAADSVIGSLMNVHWRRKILLSHYSCEYLSVVFGQME